MACLFMHVVYVLRIIFLSNLPPYYLTYFVLWFHYHNTLKFDWKHSYSECMFVIAKPWQCCLKLCCVTCKWQGSRLLIGFLSSLFRYHFFLIFVALKHAWCDLWLMELFLTLPGIRLLINMYLFVVCAIYRSQTRLIKGLVFHVWFYTSKFVYLAKIPLLMFLLYFMLTVLWDDTLYWYYDSSDKCLSSCLPE